MTSSLLAEMEKDGYTGEYKAATRGGEYQGPCILPGCNGRGNDRLRVQPSYGAYGYFECRQCGKKGSHVDYLVLNRGYTLKQALALVGWQPKESRKQSSVLPESACNGERQATHEAPCQAWQAAAKAFVTHCVQVLWSEQGKEALDYLRARGLKDETIKDARLGYNHARLERPGSKWGCRGKFILWQGIIIPWFAGEDIWRITIRDEKAEDNNRYKQVTGGSNGLYMAPYLDPRLEVPLVLLEGEIDALSVAQECRGIVSAVATGSTEGSRIGKWKVWITIRKLIFVAFDADDKGDKAAAWWLHRLHDGRRLRPLWDDANQMLQDGVDLFNNWIQPELESILYGPSPLPIPDGIWRCHACQKPFPTFEGWEIEKIPAGEVVSYDPVEGNPYCKQCRPDLFEGVVLSSDGAEASIYSIPYLTTVGQVQTLAESLEANATYVLDLETTGLNPRKNKVISIALGTADRVSVIDVRGFYAATEEEQGQWKEALQRLLHRDDITWAGHNLKFDWSFLAVHFGVRLRKVYDTILVERLLHSKKGKDRGFFRLDTVAQRYGLEVSKEARNWFVDLDQRPEEWQAVLPAEQVTYIEQDIRIPHKLLAHQQKAIEAVDLGRVTALENGALPTIAAMEIKGVAVDVERWKGILHIQRTRHTELTALLKQVLGDALADQEESQDEGRLFTVRPERPDIKLTSADQLMKALQALGIPVYGTSQGALEEVRGVHEVISQLLEWKKIQKSLSAFGESFLKRVQDDGRIHATFDQLGADSGRMSCREPNLQQMPKPKDDDTNIRSCFVAPQGHKLLVADLSNIELRILAEASQDQTMLRFFAEGKDLHAETARMMFKLGDALTADEIKGMKAPGGYKYRDAAKTINFGLAYGMGPGRLANRLGIEVEAARQLMQAYFATYKGVDGYLKRTGRAGVKDGYAVTLAGRRRTFERDLLSNPAKRGGVERAAKNHPIQGTNADILKRALALLFERLPKNVHVVLTVHDEIVLETPIDTLEVAEKHLKESMMDACRDFLKRVAVPEPDVLIAEYWVKG